MTEKLTKEEKIASLVEIIWDEVNLVRNWILDSPSMKAA